MPVEVEVARDAAVAAKLQVGARAAAHVLEPALDVVEERAPRQAAVSPSSGRIVVRVGVDGVEVEPAVVVVVDPAEAAAHHRVRLVVTPKRNAHCAEVEPDLRGDVLQLDAAERVGARVEAALRARLGRASRRDDQVAAVLQHELERAREARRAPRCVDRRAVPA